MEFTTVGTLPSAAAAREAAGSRSRVRPAAPPSIVTRVLAALETHPHAAAVLGAALQPDRGPAHAYLLHGPAGTGKRAAARAFAAELLSREAGDPSNARARVEHGSHPDLTWVAPSGAHEMLRRDVDEAVVGAAARTPFEAPWRVFVLERADTMNDEAANSLLKTLEEPPSYVVLLLLTDRPSQVLQTIASRCQGVRFDPLGPEAVAQRLQSRGVAPDAALACARLSLGEELAFLPKKEHKRREREFSERAQRADRRATTGALDQALQLIGLWYRDLACIAAGAPELVHHSDRADLLAEDAAGRGDGPLREALERVDDARARLALNVDPLLSLEALAYRLERLLGP